MHAGEMYAGAVILCGDTSEATVRPLLANYLCTGTGIRPCGLCSHCRKVLRGIHPDVTWISGEGSLKVDAVRQVRQDAYIRPNEAERKIYVFAEADGMQETAQNALLKVLEDGPHYAVFVFCLQNPERLLPTIRSRCVLWRLSPAEPVQEADSETERAIQSARQALQAGNPLAFARFCLDLEDKPKDVFQASMRALEADLVREKAKGGAIALSWIDTVRQVQTYGEGNVGQGHLLGMLLVNLP